MKGKFSRTTWYNLGYTLLVAFILGQALVGFVWVMEEGSLTAKVVIGFGFFMSVAIHMLRHKDVE